MQYTKFDMLVIRSKVWQSMFVPGLPRQFLEPLRKWNLQREFYEKCNIFECESKCANNNNKKIFRLDTFNYKLLCTSISSFTRLQVPLFCDDADVENLSWDKYNSNWTTTMTRINPMYITIQTLLRQNRRDQLVPSARSHRAPTTNVQNYNGFHCVRINSTPLLYLSKVLF